MQENAVTSATVLTTFLIMPPQRIIIFVRDKYIQSMTNLLFSSDNLSSFIYVVGKESLAEIQQKVKVPASLIIYDNSLTAPPSENTVLYIRPRKEVVILTPENLPVGEYAEKLKELNHCEVLYPFQMVIVPD